MFVASTPHRLAVLLFAAAACASQPKKPTSADVEVLTDDATVEQTLAEARLSCPWEVRNAGTARASVEAIDWELTIPGEPPQRGSERPAADVGPGASSSGVLAVRGALATTSESFAARGTDAAMRYTVSATFHVGTTAGPQSFTAEWGGELFPPRPPETAVEAQAARYSGTVELHVVLVVKNPNAFALPLEGLAYAVRVEGVEVAKGDVGNGETLPAGAERRFDLTRILGQDDHVDLADRILESTTVAYQVDTTLRAGGLVREAPLTGSIQFPK